jgi:putative ABC transport system permease protein
MGALFQDLHYAVRQVRKAPMFTLTAVAVLALGIGVNVAVFSVVQAVILRPLPYQDPNRLVHITDPHDSQDGGILYNDLTFFAEQNRAFVEMAVYYRDSGWSRVTLTDTQEPEAVQGAFVTASLFPLLDMSPTLGRTFTPEEESRHDRVVVLSYRLWQRRFG